MVSHITISWHFSDMLVYTTIIFINKSCDLSVFRRIRNLSVITLQRTLLGLTRTHSGPLKSAAAGPNRMQSATVSTWPRGSKWFPDGAFFQQVSSCSSSSDLGYQPHTSDLYYTGSSRKLRLSDFTLNWTLTPSVQGPGGFTHPLGLISNWSQTALSAHVHRRERG